MTGTLDPFNEKHRQTVQWFYVFNGYLCAYCYHYYCNL